MLLVNLTVFNLVLSVKFKWPFAFRCFNQSFFTVYIMFYTIYIYINCILYLQFCKEMFGAPFRQKCLTIIFVYFFNNIEHLYELVIPVLIVLQRKES